MFHFAIDRGGTFTDVFATCPDGSQRTGKLLSVDPDHYPDAPREGIRRILEEVTGSKIHKDSRIPARQIASIRMGTTVATNALLERKGHQVGLLITEGLRDLLQIGTQARPDIFDLSVSVPEILYKHVVEVEERVILQQKDSRLEDEENFRIVTDGGGARELRILRPLNEAKLRKDLKALKETGVESLAVALTHSYLWPQHELRCEAIAKEIGFQHISLSSSVMPMERLVPRGQTACVDAYLSPLIRQYICQFINGFDDDIVNANIFFMQSDGGLVPASAFTGCRAILSGPAGGLVGFARTSYSVYTQKPVIGFDMGGTSTDVSRYEGSFDLVFETQVAGVAIQAPQMNIHTVAAGGGSRLFYRGGMFVVGPESAGAHPGPACYRKGGPLTVTDANLVLGRLLPEYFPKIFGHHKNESLSKAASEQLFAELAAELETQKDPASGPAIQAIALGFINVANEAMTRAIRNITQGKGFDPAKHYLACFGGAGGQHACSIARVLGMQKVFINKYAGILSAYGMILADVVHDIQRPCGLPLAWEGMSGLQERTFSELEKECLENLTEQGFKPGSIRFERFLNLRYKGTDCALMVSGSDFKENFLKNYLREFGFTVPEGVIVVDDIRVRASASPTSVEMNLLRARTKEDGPLKPEQVTPVYFEISLGRGDFLDSSVYRLEKLFHGDSISGPAIIIDKLSTVLVEPGCRAQISKYGDIEIDVTPLKRDEVSEEEIRMNPVQLGIFGHRFMGIAEQMGVILRRTSLSTNIKERLDFSCALFGPDGGLVSNAPHIPVHLGAMQETVQYQMKTRQKFERGEVLLSNHPIAGGSHLPDLTVITPVFEDSEAPSENDRPIFFVASRGHHADIGGITPGSMPPHSRSLSEEGASFISFDLVKNSVFQEEKLSEVLRKAGSRNIKDNLADLRAQVSANHRGILLVKDLLREYGKKLVLSYMGFIQTAAELAVRDLLKRVGNAKLHGCERILHSEDRMDDGTYIRLCVKIDCNEGTAVVDFSGTDRQVLGNWNAPRSITTSALIYTLRSLVPETIPLNQGCLAPVKLIVPEGCILAPRADAAVVGGNVLTSQRVVDVILGAFDACAASQGCMNNITFGDASSGYYETVAGGAGAGPTWNGTSGIHTHMTNTRITDVEILEERYPVILKRFELRRGSGGGGLFRGGDGVCRELLFRRSQTLSVLTERRVFAPWGANGGEDGLKGENVLLRAKDRQDISLGSKSAVDVEPGDVFLLMTPGGGGWGQPPGGP
ncbi:unnamed protein product [Cyprideis torosa]|uniref:Uncharacterized protein n=1 Tax=Cyprideis torosa TaxID=163714 RepID=A0A7R8ZLN1_9CRUS|nr:unnamed protein product [Cyprideis torosa]CAG0882607.1 unnamed protein product [Cyprideis torosa]